MKSTYFRISGINANKNNEIVIDPQNNLMFKCVLYVSRSSLDLFSAFLKLITCAYAVLALLVVLFDMHRTVFEEV